MQYLSVALPLAALASGVLASPAQQWGGASCQDNACLAAVTGKGALGDSGLRASHCSSYLATTVTPIVTVTDTVTGWGNDNWKRATVALCPNEVPNYASACDDAAYTSACSCFGYTGVKTITIAPTTTTKTIWVKPTGGSASGSICTSGTATIIKTSTVVSGTTCPAASTSTVTKTLSGSSSWSASTVVYGTTCPSVSTVTKTLSGSGTWSASTVTVTVPSATGTTVTVSTCSTPSLIPTACNVDDASATKLVNNFVDLLEHTSYAGSQGAPGSGYDQDVSDATLATDFIDISDSINFMAGFPLGSVTFNSKSAFDYGQGVLQPEVTVQVLNIWHDCNTVTWRWRIVSLPYPVNGINHMEINSDGKIQKNWAEFDSGAWLQSFGKSCAINNVTVASSASKRSLLDM